MCDFYVLFSSHGMSDGIEDDQTQLINAREQERLVSVNVNWRELQIAFYHVLNIKYT